MEAVEKQEMKTTEDFSEMFIGKIFEKLMGQCLDLMRIGMPLDRAFNQAERNTRQNFNTAKQYMLQTLKEKGYLKGELHGTD